MDPRTQITRLRTALEAREWASEDERKEAMGFVLQVEKVLTLDNTQGQTLCNVINRAAASMNIDLNVEAPIQAKSE